MVVFVVVPPVLLLLLLAEEAPPPPPKWSDRRHHQKKKEGYSHETRLGLVVSAHAAHYLGLVCLQKSMAQVVKNKNAAGFPNVVGVHVLG